MHSNRCSARPLADNTLEPLSKDPPSAERRIADKSPDNKTELALPSGTGQVRNRSHIAAVNPTRCPPAKRTLSCLCPCAGGNSDGSFALDDAFNNQSGWNQ